MNAGFSRSILVLALAVPLTASAHGSTRNHRYDGYVRVENDTAEALLVRVDGNDSRLLRPWETVRFRADSGYVSVSATYEAFGQQQLLANRTVKVYAGRTSEVELRPPSRGLVRVVNDTGVYAELLADGREVAELRPGQAQVVSLSLGNTSLVLVANGVAVERARVDVRPFIETTLVGRAPARADLVVYNPFPFAVTLTCDRGLSRVVEARGRVVYDDVPVGSFHLVARRSSGQVVDDERIAVDPWRGGAWTIDPPTTGLVRLDNEHHEPVRVYQSGRLVATLGARQDSTVTLAVGSTTLEVREFDGRMVDREFLTVDPYRTTTVEFGWPGEPVYTSGQHRPDDHHAEDHGHGEPRHSCTM